MEVLPTEDQLLPHQYWKKKPNYFPRSSSCDRTPRSTREENSPKGKQIRSVVSLSKKSTPRKGQIDNKPKQKFRKDSPPERRNFSKIEENVENSAPKIKILQRPQSKEAAMLDLAKITGMPLSEVYAKSGLNFATEEQVKVVQAKKKTDLEDIPSNPVKMPSPNRKGSEEVVKKKEFVKVEVSELIKKSNVVVSEPVKKRELANKFANLEVSEVVEVTKATVAETKSDSSEMEVTKNVTVFEETKKVGAPKSVKFVEVSKKSVEVTKVEETKKVTTPVKTLDKKSEEKSATPKMIKQQKMVTTKRTPTPPPFIGNQVGPCTKNFADVFLPMPLLDEKWAGPAFTNSPPPSCLPIPRFATCRSESLEAADITELATQGLRRILNLDL